MEHPTFKQIAAGEATEHVAQCAECQKAIQAIATVRTQAPPPKRRFFLWLAPIAAAAGILLFVLTGKARPVRIELVKQELRAHNSLDRDVYVGAYVRDAAGAQHWLLRPSLVTAGAELVTSAATVPSGQLVGFAAESPDATPFYEVRKPVGQ